MAECLDGYIQGSAGGKALPREGTRGAVGGLANRLLSVARDQARFWQPRPKRRSDPAPTSSRSSIAGSSKLRNCRSPRQKVPPPPSDHSEQRFYPDERPQ
jgi:hypothetical protein